MPLQTSSTAPADEPALDTDAAGIDLTVIREFLDLSPGDRLRAFEIWMADIVRMLDAADRAWAARGHQAADRARS